MNRGLTAKQRGLVRAVNPALAAYVDSIDGSWAERLQALRQVAAMLKAEREALQELAAVGMLREGVASLVELRGKLDLTIQETKVVGVENDRLKKRLRAATALPAMAVPGD